jgi:serine/threonine-protein kinase
MTEPAYQTGSSATSSARPIEASGALRAPTGPETVINPERRALAVAAGAGAVPVGSSVKSSVVKILFPAEDDPAAQTFDAQQGVQLGHFTVIERIRTGGMGAVFRALDTRLARVVALKVLPPALSRDPLVVQRFKNEAQAAAQLDHENVARVYYIGEDHGLNYIAFEFISGTNVRDLIARDGHLPVGEAVNYILQIATALVHTSAQGVIHRDIKPSNIIITPSGRAKLVDLGLARKENREDNAVELTVAGTTLGTFDYISPEQARDPRGADVRSDIYSLGCTLYHMLTGEPPYPEGTVLQKLLQHQGDEAPDPSIKNRQVPQNLAVVVRKMMAKDPRRRYQSPEQLVRDLMLVAGAMGLRSVSPEGLVWLAAQPERTSFWERHLAWMVTAALLLVIAGYMEFGGGSFSPAALSPSPYRGLQNGERDGIESRATNGGGHAGSSVADNSRAPGSNGSTPRPTRVASGPDAQESELNDDDRLHPRGADSLLSDDVRRSGASERTNRDDLGADPDDAGGAIVPVPLAGTLRGSEGPAASGPRYFPTAPDAKTSRTIVDGSGSSGRAAVVTTPPGRTDDGAREPGPEPREGATRLDTDPLPAIPAEDEAFVIIGRDGAPDLRFKSLEAACSSVRNDGAVIELRFSGRRRETSVRINRKVTIRAARGYRPVVEFRPTETAAGTYQVRGVWLPSGSLDLVGVDVALSVDEFISADQWSLFALERADSLRLQGVTMTLLNPRQRSVAAIELRPGAGAMMPDMPVAGAQSKPPLEVEISESLVRGDGDLFVVRHAEPARLAIKQSVVALQGTLLSARGHSESSHENAQLELRLEHVTAVLAGGLVRLDSGSTPRKILPIQVAASNSIFSNSAGAPLVAMTGNSPPQDFHALLFWVGQNNFFDRYQTFWSIVSTEGTGRTEAWDAATWRKNWTEASESNPQFDAVVWSRRPWMTRPFAELTAGDFTLDRQASNNAAVGGATNFSDAGANLAAIPRPPVAGAEDR